MLKKGFAVLKMGKRKRDATDENTTFNQKMDNISENIPNCDDVIKSHKKKKKKHDKSDREAAIKETDVEGSLAGEMTEKSGKKKERSHEKQTEAEANKETWEVQANIEDVKRDKKKRKHKDKTEDLESTATDQPVKEDKNHKVKRKKHKHKEENRESSPEAEDEIAEHQESHKQKRKKHKSRNEVEDVAVDEMLETNSEHMRSAKKKKRKHREKDEETADSKDAAEVEIEEEEVISKKKRKYDKEENKNVPSEMEDCKTKNKASKAKPDELTQDEILVQKPEEVDKKEKISRDGVDEETRRQLQQKWQDKMSFKKLMMQHPKMFLIDNFSNDEDDKTTFKPVEVQDLQDIIQIAVLGNASNTNKVRFCKLIRSAKITKVVVMVLNGVTDKHFQKNKDCFSHLTANYDLTGQILNQELQQKLSILSQLIFVPVSRKELRKRAYVARNYGVDSKTAPAGPAVVAKPAQSSAGTKPTATPGRTHYLLKEQDMVMWRYPMADDPAYTHTKHSDTVSDSSPIVSVDCEMCVTKIGNELTRVSLIDEKYNVLYNSLVKPRNAIIDYVTKYSGITKQLLDPVTTTLEDAQKDIIALLPADVILVGQSLENDLRALKLYHPHVVDTSNMFTGSYRVALRKLVWKYLGMTIQAQESGHDSIEDAVATLKLLHLKLEKGNGLEKYYSNSNKHSVETVPTESIFKCAQSLGKVSMLVDSMSVTRQFMKDPVGALACQNDEEALKKAVQAVPYSDFVCVQFYNFLKLTQGISQEETGVEETMKHLDQRIKKIHKKLPFNSLFLVVMARDPNKPSSKSSNTEDKFAHGRFFVGLKVKY